MADKPVDEVVQVDAALDALSSPTSSDVYEALNPYSDSAVAAVAVKRALAGGGGSDTVHYAVVSVNAADILASDPNDPSSWQTVLAALATGKFRFYLQPILYLRAGATPYAGVVSAQLVNPGDNALLVDFGNFDMTSATDLFNTGAMNGATNPAASTSNDPTQIAGANSEAQMYFFPQPADGNGTITLYLPYMIIDTAATS